MAGVPANKSVSIWASIDGAFWRSFSAATTGPALNAQQQRVVHDVEAFEESRVNAELPLQEGLLGVVHGYESALLSLSFVQADEILVFEGFEAASFPVELSLAINSAAL